MFSKKNFKSKQLLRNTLDIIKSIYSHNDFLALELFFQFRDAGFTFRFLEGLK